jgi:plastocyanin
MADSTCSDHGGNSMKGYGISLAIIAGILVWSSPVSAHDECDDEGQPKVAITERAGSASPQSQPVSNVAIKLFQYQPGRIQVRAGTAVTWVNEDQIFHTVTADVPEQKSGGFNAALDGKGKTFSFIFSQLGTYSYYCERHEHMRGEIEVR